MVNYSHADVSAFNTGEHNGNGSHNDTEHYAEIYSSERWLNCAILPIFSILICSFGIWGNGTVIWLLAFCIKRNPFTTYILNLAIADFAFLTSAIIEKTEKCMLLIVLDLFYYVHFSTFSASQYLLTVISMDRCVSVFFPLWHRFHRPTYLSTIVCALLWVVSFLPPAVSFILYMDDLLNFPRVIIIQFIVNCFLCIPLMTTSSLMIFIKVCCKSKQQKRGKLLITILATTFFFLFLCFPLNIGCGIYFFFGWNFTFYDYIKLCACLNSSVNPLIYYLVGRQKKGRSNKSMKTALQTLFKEEEI